MQSRTRLPSRIRYLITTRRLGSARTGSALRIGEVWKLQHSASNPHLVPVTGSASQEHLPPSTLHHLKWLLQKDIAGQDVFLLGDPGPSRRRLAALYCELANREVEYLVLSRDTTEGDIKQRREISAGSSLYNAGPAVRAALEGRTLVIEGIERAEQNLLPILNNLLENREMHLEDGRFLVSPSRFDTLSSPSSELLRVHPDFWVIGLGVPVPPYKGYPLDPPLRSRFQARVVRDLQFAEQLNMHSQGKEVTNSKIHSLLSFGAFFKQQEAKTLPFMSSASVESLAKIVEKVPSVEPSKLVPMVYPYAQLLQPESKVRFESVLSALGLSAALSRKKGDICKVVQVEDRVALVKCGTHSFSVPAGDTRRASTEGSYHPTPAQEALLSDMLLSHSVADICITGPPGCGKSEVIGEFARRLGYETDTVVLYSDMTSRDLLQHRHTDSKGNTIWEHSSLVRAALEGHLLVLDSLHKLHPTACASLASLCEDRTLRLPDGKQLLSAVAHEELTARLGASREQLEERGVLKIHPTFRIVATGEEKGDWMTSDVLGMWHFHNHPALDLQQQLKLISRKCPVTGTHHVKKLQRMSDKLRADSTLAGIGAMLTTRRLLAICRTVEDGEDLGNAIHQALLSRFMPSLTRQTLTAVLRDLGIVETVNIDDVTIESTPDSLTIGSVCVPKLNGARELIPSTTFFENQNQIRLLESLLRSYKSGSHLLLVGNQGVGKNKLVDRMLELLGAEREYLQLHRDTTVQSITVQPCITGGRVEYADSALVRAVRRGRVLVVDEADKAPTNVTSVLRTLLDTGSMWLSDGRKIVPADTATDTLTDNHIRCHPNFRAIFLANRPGFPFLGNDFYAVMGDMLACHAIDNPDPASELALLKQYGPGISEDVLVKLISAFGELRAMSDTGTFLYPYSTRELVNIIKHMQAYPEDGITTALCNVLDFEIQEGDIWEMIVRILHKHEIPFGAKPITNVAPRFPLPPSVDAGKLSISGQGNLKTSKGSFRKRGPYILSNYTVDVPATLKRAQSFSECVSVRNLPLTSNNTKYTHLAPGGEEGTMHVLSSNPHVLYTLSPDDSQVRCLDISHALGFRPEISLAASNNLVVIADKSTDTIVLVDASQHTVTRLSHNRSFPFNKSPLSGFRVVAGEGECCWLHSNNHLIRYNMYTNQTVECELPFPISSVTVLSADCVTCRSRAGDWYHVTPGEGRWRRLQVQGMGSEEANWLSDSSSGNETGITHDAILTPGHALVSENCSETLLKRGEVALSALQTTIATPRGMLHGPLLLVPTKKIPERYTKEPGETGEVAGSGERGEVAGDTRPSGHLAAIDLSRNTVSFIPLAGSASKTRYDNPEGLLISRKSHDKIATLTTDGILQDWELAEDALAMSYAKWREMVGDPQVQLSISRTSGLDTAGPKHGKIDPTNAPHAGGNTWAGGTGGRDTAGLGGKGGPYRLDAGHNVHQLSDEEKNSVPPEVQKAAREMGRKEFEKRLQEIKMSHYDAERYSSFLQNVSQQITSLKQLVAGLEAKQGDRVWLKNQTDGELDDAKIVEGLTGERNVYKRRGLPQEKGLNLTKPKHLTLLVDVSGSMYRFNGLDQRLQRELEVMAMVMEGLEGAGSRLRYDIIGHSGEDPHIRFLGRETPPENQKKRLHILEEMQAHSQFCWTGDHTVSALEQAVSHAAAVDADERIVIAFSDANLQRYSIRPGTIARLMGRDPSVSVFMIFIGSLGDEAEQLKRELPAGRSFVTMDTREIPTILQQIFSSAMMQ